MRKKLIPNYIMAEFQKNPQIGRTELAKKCNITEGEARSYCWVYKQMTTQIKFKGKGIALYDLHFPSHDKACLNAVCEFIKDFKPDWLILGGDQLQLDMISSYNQFKLKNLEGKRLYKDYKEFQIQVLNRIESLLPKNCKKFFMLGNHEYRIDRLIEKHPELEGLIELENHLNLKDWTIIPYNDTFSIGDMYFAHGWYWNKYYAEKTLRIAQKMIFVGHAHTPQIHTAISPVYTLPKQCTGIGCLCNINPEYLENAPNAWVHQFLFWYMFSDGTFTYYTPIIINGRCIINGKVYDGNEGIKNEPKTMHKLQE